MLLLPKSKQDHPCCRRSRSLSRPRCSQQMPSRNHRESPGRRPKIEEGCFKVDRLQRLHWTIPSNGPLHVFNRSTRFFKATSAFLLYLMPIFIVNGCNLLNIIIINLCQGLPNSRSNQTIILTVIAGCVKKLLFLSLVKSRLTYCSQVWRPHNLKDINLFRANTTQGNQIHSKWFSFWL